MFNFLEKLLNLITCLILIGVAYLIWDANTAINNAQDRRLDLIEQRIKDKTRPIINIQRGTVYSAKGEIIIEEVKK